MQIFRKFEDVLDFAIGQEQAAQQFYTELAGKVTSPEVQEFYRSLIEEEKQHEKNLKAVKKLSRVPYRKSEKHSRRTREQGGLHS